MNFISAMQNRYTTKMYDNTKKIDRDKIEALKEILRLSPSSINSQPWQFLFVSDKETKKKLAEVSFFNKNRIIDSDTLVVFSRIENIALFEEQIKVLLPTGAVDYYNQFIKIQSEEQIRAWFDRQVYLALGVFLGACAEMQIDATPMEGVVPEKYNDVLGLSDYSTLMAVAIGYRDENDANQVSKNPKSRKALNQVITSI